MSHHHRDDSISLLQRHHKYYIDAGDLHILAEKTHFRVHGYFFARESAVFRRKLNPTSPGDVKQGTNDHDPIVLEGVSATEFEKLLWVFYNPKYSLYDASIEDWQCVLNLANKWEFQEVKELCVRELHRKQDLDLVTKMALYQKYSVNPKHLVPLYAALCERDTPLDLEESKILGMETVVLINTTRERLRADPSNGGRSPLPSGLEKDDIYRSLERDLGIEVGSTTKHMEEFQAAMAKPVNSHAENGGLKLRVPAKRGGRASLNPSR